ncbi:MAG: bi-domain-containing oxidoreductase [Candidatus Latescibacteria bacterium]|nr:bi-domain-containing oxidoreductase [Candidatus Latescibacterota bacterium]
MKQVLIHQGRVTVESVPAPLVEPGHLLVEVAYSLISAGTEITSVEASGKSLIKRALKQPDKVRQVLDHLYRQGIRKTVVRVQGQRSSGSPTGYSCSGIVLQVGQGMTDIRPGDAVACAGAGVANHAEIVLVPRNLFVKVPEGCDLKAAASVTLGAIAMQGVRRADPRLGEIVAVIGLGLLGQLTVQLLKVAGCRVIGLDIDPRRVVLARQAGADRACISTEVNPLDEVRHLTDGRGVDATIVTASSMGNAIVQQAMQITRRKGRVVVVGAVGLGLKRSPFYEKEIDFLISCSYGPGRYDNQYEEQGVDYPYAYVRWTENRNMEAYLRLIAEGKVQVGSILEREYDVAQAPQAYEELRTAPEKPLGVLLCYPLSDLQAQTPKLATHVVLRSQPVRGRISVAVVGAGSFAKGMHLPHLRQLSDRYHLRAVVSTTGSNAKATAQQFGADYASTSYEDLLNDSDTDAVVICTRHHLHASMVLEALKAGKHVMVEKPLALTQDELDRIEAFYASASPDKPLPVLLTGFNRRFSPSARRIHDLIQGRRTPMILTYRMNAGYIPPDNWVHTAEGGGRNRGEACHIYDLFTYLTGSKVLRVSAEALHPSTGRYSYSDNFIATTTFEDGSIATLTYTALGTEDYPKERLEIFVDGKVFVLDDYKRLTVFGTKVKGEESTIAEKGHKEELEAFADVIRQGGEWPIPLWQQVQATEISFEVEERIRQ